MIIPGEATVFSMLKSWDWKDRFVGEFWETKLRYEKLHNMIIKREAGTLDFQPGSPMEVWKAQAAAMGNYLYQLEVRAEHEGINLLQYVPSAQCD